MVIDHKQVVREVVGSYLAEFDPDDFREFEVVFDDVYAALASSKDAAKTETKRLDEGCSFDGVSVSPTIVSIACLVAFNLAKAALKDFQSRDLPKVLDTLETQLASAVGKPGLVHVIRQRIQGILQHL